MMPIESHAFSIVFLARVSSMIAPAGIPWALAVRAITFAAAQVERYIKGEPLLNIVSGSY